MKRWMAIKEEKYVKEKNNVNIEHFKYELIKSEFPIAYHNFIDQETISYDPHPNTIKALILGLKDKDKGVREASLNSIGVIGLPYVESALPFIET